MELDLQETVNHSHDNAENQPALLTRVIPLNPTSPAIICKIFGKNDPIYSLSILEETRPERSGDM